MPRFVTLGLARLAAHEMLRGRTLGEAHYTRDSLIPATLVESPTTRMPSSLRHPLWAGSQAEKRLDGLETEQHAPGVLVLLRGQADMLGHRMDIAQTRGLLRGRRGGGRDTSSCRNGDTLTAIGLCVARL